MPLFSFEGLTPQVHASAFVAPTATLVGDVIVEEGASIWYGAVIRADYAPVIVRARRERAGQRGHPRTARADDRHRRRARPSATTAWCTARSSKRSASSPTASSCSTARRSAPARSSRPARSSPRVRRSRPGCSSRVRRRSSSGRCKGTGAEVWVETNPEAYAELAQRHQTGIRYVDPDDDRRRRLTPHCQQLVRKTGRHCANDLLRTSRTVAGLIELESAAGVDAGAAVDDERARRSSTTTRRRSGRARPTRCRRGRRGGRARGCAPSPSSFGSHSARAMSVFTSAGAIALTRTPGASSCASWRVRWMSAAFDTLYAPMNGPGPQPADRHDVQHDAAVVLHVLRATPARAKRSGAVMFASKTFVTAPRSASISGAERPD